MKLEPKQGSLAEHAPSIPPQRVSLIGLRYKRRKRPTILISVDLTGDELTNYRCELFLQVVHHRGDESFVVVELGEYPNGFFKSRFNIDIPEDAHKNHRYDMALEDILNELVQKVEFLRNGQSISVEVSFKNGVKMRAMLYPQESVNWREFLKLFE